MLNLTVCQALSNPTDCACLTGPDIPLDSLLRKITDYEKIPLLRPAARHLLLCSRHASVRKTAGGGGREYGYPADESPVCSRHGGGRYLSGKTALLHVWQGRYRGE